MHKLKYKYGIVILLFMHTSVAGDEGEEYKLSQPPSHEARDSSQCFTAATHHYHLHPPYLSKEEATPLLHADQDAGGNGS